MAALDHGLFWQIFTAPNGYRRVWHNGETGGYSSYLAVYPEAKKAVIVLAAHANAFARRASPLSRIRSSIRAELR